MGAPPLRLVAAAAALSVAGALLPVGAAIAAPDAAGVSSDHAPASVLAPLTDGVPVVVAEPQKAVEEELPAATDAVRDPTAPPVGLLALLVPILLGGRDRDGADAAPPPLSRGAGQAALGACGVTCSPTS